MMTRFFRKYQLVIFCLFNILVTFFSIVILHSDYIPQWMPGISALLLTGLVSGRKGVARGAERLRLKESDCKWDLMSLAIPVITSLLVYRIIICGIEDNEQLHFTFNHDWQEYISAVVFIAIGSLGEEIGWRGFLLPNLLKKYSFFKSSFITGFVWGLWHFRFDSGIALFLIYILFAVETSIVISWLHRKTNGRITTAIIYHMAINTCGLFLFENILIDTNPEYFQLLFFGIYSLLLIVPCIFILFSTKERPSINNKSCQIGK